MGCGPVISARRRAEASKEGVRLSISTDRTSRCIPFDETCFF